MHGLGLDRRLEPAVELVVERAGAVHRRDVLGDAGQVVGALARVPEDRRELRCEVDRAVEPEHGHEAAREDRLHDLRVRVLLVRVGASGQTRIVAENRGL